MLRKAEKALLEKLTIAVGYLLEQANREWTDREISELTKVPPNRLTEYKKFKKYKRSVTINNFVKLLGGGIFTVEDIINVVPDLSKAEIEYLTDINFYEDAELRKKIIANKKAGIDPVEAQTLLQDLKRIGIDPIELMRSARKKKL